MKNIPEDMLQVYVDGRLEESRRQEVEALAEEAFAVCAAGTPWRKTVFRWAAAVTLILAGGAGGWWLHGFEENRSSAVAGLAEGAAAAYAVFTAALRLTF